MLLMDISESPILEFTNVTEAATDKVYCEPNLRLAAKLNFKTLVLLH
jgi:hypothetical protein